MLIYEVTAKVDAAFVDEFERYLIERHIPDVLATGKLKAAFFIKKDVEHRIGYHCDSQEDLDAYLANDAPALRTDVAERFPSGVELSRQVFDILALFPGPDQVPVC